MWWYHLAHMTAIKAPVKRKRSNSKAAAAAPVPKSTISNTKQIITLDLHQQQHRQQYKKQYGTGQGRRLTEQQKRELQELFYMDGITAWHAHKLTGVTYRAVKKYFQVWGEELVNDEEHEPWTEKQKRVRARSLEGLTRQIVNVQTRLTTLEHQYAQLTRDTHEVGGSSGGTGKNKKIIHKYKHVSQINPQLQYGLDDQLRKNTILLEELKAQAFAIQMLPPADVILEKEVEKQLAETGKLHAEDNK